MTDQPKANLEKADLCERLSFPPEDSRHIAVDALLREYAVILRAQAARPSDAAVAWRDALVSVLAEIDLRTAPKLRAKIDAALALPPDEPAGVAIPHEEAVRAQTIEECAKICDGLRHKDYSAENEDWIAGTSDCAKAIRTLQPSKE